MWELTSSSDLSLAPHAGGADQLLVARCLQGDDVAVAQLYDRYAQPVFRLCVGILGHRQDAEEVLQDTFEYAFRRLAKYDARRAGFKTWLYQIAVSRCRNKRRRKWLQTIGLGQLPHGELADEATPSPPAAAAEEERKRIVWQALAELSPKLREAVVLRYYGAFTYEEMGRVLDIPGKTAESRVRLAHQALHERLANLLDEGDTP